ncbi:MAG: type II toxin-antitoxin system VapC family toxin [Candidatus Dormibacteria bacterium]
MGHDESRDRARRTGLTLFIDTAVLMYAGGQEHSLRAPCRELLGHVGDQRVDAVTSAEVIQEIFHRFVGAGHAQVGIEMARAALDLFAPVLPISHAVMARMPGLALQYPGMSSRDLVHVATCMEEGIGVIVSPDRAFDQVEGLRRVAPDDGASIAAELRR